MEKSKILAIFSVLFLTLGPLCLGGAWSLIAIDGLWLNAEGYTAIAVSALWLIILFEFELPRWKKK